MNNPLIKTQIEPEGRFITIIIDHGTANSIISALNKEFDIRRFYFNSARGMTLIKSKIIGDFIFVEKDIITIVVQADISNRIFEYVYNLLDVNNRPGSFIYMGETAYISKFSFESKKDN